MNIPKLIILFSLIFFPSATLAQESKADSDDKKAHFKRYTFEYELDAYYSNAGIYYNLADKPIPDAGDKPEVEVYKELFYSSFIPRFVIFEAALFPMPSLGIFLKKNGESFYEEAHLGSDLNLVKALTAGFEEPYAFTLFLGNVIQFTSSNGKKERGNFGYMGYLLSVGDYHIKDNELIKDDWLEMELKVKGDQKFSLHKLNWSYRVGVKLHNHIDITDVLYLSMRRSRIDYKDSKNSILRNIGIEYTFQMDLRTLQPVRHYFLLEKKIPIKKKKNSNLHWARVYLGG